jgi:predicted nucleotidyltransferase
LVETPEAEAARVLASEPAVLRVILFGSRAQGTARRSSDMDIAIVAPELEPRALARLWDRLDDRQSLVRVDLHRLEALPPDWRDEILRTGVVLFERT